MRCSVTWHERRCTHKHAPRAAPQIDLQVGPENVQAVLWERGAIIRTGKIDNVVFHELYDDNNDVGDCGVDVIDNDDYDNDSNDAEGDEADNDDNEDDSNDDAEGDEDNNLQSY